MGREVRISVSEFQDAVMKALEDTRIVTDKAVTAAVNRTAKEVTAKIKGESPEKTGAYKRGWSSKVTTKQGRGRYGRTVYNGPRYMLAHLLQNGHGGAQPAGPRPHIHSDEETEELFVKNMEREMGKQ